jgi:hypothetical protein
VAYLYSKEMSCLALLVRMFFENESITTVWTTSAVHRGALLNMGQNCGKISWFLFDFGRPCILIRST